MIYTRKQFEERLRKIKKKDLEGKYFYLEYSGYNEAIDDVLKLIEDEGGCFRE